MMEIYFDKMIIFPYMFTDEIQKIYGGYYDDCNIYMLMLQDKLEIVEVINERYTLQIKYKNIATKNVKNIIIYKRDLLGIDIPNQYIETSIDKFGEILKIKINMEVFNTIRILWGLPSDMSNIFMYNIYDILTLAEREIETSEEYEVIYIGQSDPKKEYKTVFDRLRSHEKVAKVFREYNLEYRDKELMVFILHTKSKLLNKDGVCYSGNTKWKDYDEVGEKINDSAIIDIAEAMLIYHFKPHYNIKLKDSMPSKNKKVYRQLVEAGLNSIILGLNLYLQPCRNCVKLFTEVQRTTTKLRDLMCNIDILYHDDTDVFIEYEDITDQLYERIHK